MSTALCNATPAWLGGYEPYQVSCNQIRAADLFTRYEQCGFLYPQKRERLDPYLHSIASSWDASTQDASPEGIHFALESCEEAKDAWACVSIWRSTMNRVHSQHLVSQGWPGCSRRVMLAGQDWITLCGFRYAENWFRAENRYPNRIFGSVPRALGSSKSALERRALIALLADQLPPDDGGVRVERLHDQDGGAARRWLSEHAGPVIAGAEELDTGDMELKGLDTRYARFGLSRTRRVYAARMAGDDEPAGIACAYRGPLGLNFSFLENRCDVWLHKRLGAQDRVRVVCELARAALPVYAESPLPYMLLVCDEPAADGMRANGIGRGIRTYTRCVWTREGFWEWLCHVDSFYTRVIQAEERRGRVGVEGDR